MTSSMTLFSLFEWILARITHEVLLICKYCMSSDYCCATARQKRANNPTTNNFLMNNRIYKRVVSHYTNIIKVSRSKQTTHSFIIWPRFSTHLFFYTHIPFQFPLNLLKITNIIPNFNSFKPEVHLSVLLSPKVKSMFDHHFYYNHFLSFYNFI